MELLKKNLQIFKEGKKLKQNLLKQSKLKMLKNVNLN